MDKFMKTPHINAEKDEISDIVLMPGDPLRAKLIAENYLEDYKLVNEVRNMLAYTGYYKGRRVTVMGSGMGMASMGIYSYELFKFYDVQTIIRIGSCGCHETNVKLGATVLAKKSYSKTKLDDAMFGDKTNVAYADAEVNNKIKEAAAKINIDLIEGDVTTLDVFDIYAPNLDKSALSFVEMESYALFKIARHLERKCACLLTVVDIDAVKEHMTAEERETKLNDMILVALESTLSL